MKKVISLILCLLLSVTVIGCTPTTQNPGNTDPTKTLDIAMWNSGYGTKWVEQLKEEYLKTHPDVVINIDAKSGQSGTSVFYNTITTGVNANNNDLYFAYGPKYLDYVTGQYSSNPLLESLNDVVNYTVPGESKTIGEKIGSSVLDVMIYDNGTTDSSDDKYYALSFANGASGIVYNSKLFDQYGLSVPRTTDEMINLVVQIQDETPYKGTRDGKVVFNQPATAFIHYPGYWSGVAQTWWAQYEGEEGMSSFWNFENLDLDNPQQEDYQTEGMKYALEALYNIIGQTGATHATSNTESDYMIIQSNFIENEVALMYPCGGFLETELEKLDGFDLSLMNNFKMMREPVLSAVANKLDDGHKTDSHLCELIDYVDGVAGRPDWASDNEVEIVRNARYISTGQASSSTIAIPSYSPSKELAKDFLKFMFSDEGMKIFAETQRTFLKFSFDDPTTTDSINKDSWTNFAKSVFEISKESNAYYAPSVYSHPLRYKAGLIEWLDINGAGTPEYWFTNPSETQRKNPTDYLGYSWSKLMAQWDVYLQGAGLAN